MAKSATTKVVAVPRKLSIAEIARMTPAERKAILGTVEEAPSELTVDSVIAGAGQLFGDIANFFEDAPTTFMLGFKNARKR